jgi:hypothetical protein
MRMILQVTYVDGSGADAVVSAPDFVAFEKEFDRSVARFETEVKFTDICWLAWHRLNRANNVGDFDKWLENLDSVEIKDSGDLVPLDKTPPIST